MREIHLYDILFEEFDRYECLKLQAGYSSPTHQDAIRTDLGLSLAEYSLFGSILTFGAMIGAITAGPIADLIGRKGAMRVSSAFCVAGWLVIFFFEGPIPLDIGRLATGYGMGSFSYVVGFTHIHSLLLVIVTFWYILGSM
ncbi:sugar transporter ERD6-like 7 [Arachis ipaensis]|uniref:sugar transporter ERD6-like 7 n=1 Tax=Arachis ipaensis TaxID=130454 RepID=UPI0007AEE949|nr:sugar transporter ERD6-like 7 [Arachis ipaensis]XP_025668913.1 sugar transporter ERD6-like 7 [Arachis hypogaea]